MSHYTKIKTQIKNRAALVRALEDLGFKGVVEVNDVAKNLYGYMGDQREQKANVILRRKDVGGSSNDLGFVLREDGTYEAIISEFDAGSGASAKNDITKGCRGYGEKWQGLLNQHYAKHVIEEEAAANGMSTSTVETDAEGTLYIYVDSPY